MVEVLPLGPTTKRLTTTTTIVPEVMTMNSTMIDEKDGFLTIQAQNGKSL